MVILFAALLAILPLGYAAAPAPTRVTLAVSPADDSLTATVRTALGEPVGTGTVDFLLPSGASLGSAVVTAEGTATLPLPRAIPGTSVAAAYRSGTGSFSDGGSPSVALPAAATLPDFAVTGNPTTVTAAAGSYGATTLNVSSLNGYAGAMEFSCSGLPAQVTCAFNPIQASLAANGSFIATLQLETQAPSGAQSRLWSRGTIIAYALVLPGAFAFLGLARRRRGQLFTLFLLLGAGAGLGGCSQRYSYLKHPPPVAGGTPAGTYTITVAVDGAVGATVTEHDLPITLVVQ